MIYCGVTGTQTPGPLAHGIIREWLGFFDPARVIIVQGCCIGIDEQVAVIAHELGFQVWGIVPDNRSKVSQAAVNACNHIVQMPSSTSYMERNDEIVRLSDVLYGFPKTDQEEVRSGTWATIRRGRKKGIRVGIIPVGASA